MLGQRPVFNQMPPLMGQPPFMGQPPLMGQPPFMGQPLGPPFMGIGIGPMNPMSQQTIQNMQRGIFPFGNPPPPMGVPQQQHKPPILKE
jgi:hypothetical protein